MINGPAQTLPFTGPCLRETQRPFCGSEARSPCCLPQTLTYVCPSKYLWISPRILLCFWIFLLHNSFLSIILPTYLSPRLLCPQTAACSAHTPLVSAPLPLSTPPSAWGSCLPCSKQPSTLWQGEVGQCLGLCVMLGIPWEDTGPWPEMVALLLRQALQKELLPPEGVLPVCASSWWMQSKHIF